jgi:hypothetical protein
MATLADAKVRIWTLAVSKLTQSTGLRALTDLPRRCDASCGSGIQLQSLLHRLEAERAGAARTAHGLF